MQISLGLTHDIWIDSLAVEHRAQRALSNPTLLDRAVERAKLCRALRLYKGDFLTQQDDDNIVIERERIRALYLDANYELAQAYARHSDWLAVAETCRALCFIEPLREDAQRLLIEAYASSGNRALAIQQYRNFAKLLEQELSVAPMQETQAVIDDIVKGEVENANPVKNITDIPEPVIPNKEIRAMLSQMRRQVQSTLNLIDSALGK